MIELSLVGIGTGNPKHLTLQAIEALNTADLILIPTKGAAKDDLAELRRQICAHTVTAPSVRIAEFALPERDPAITDYAARVAAWHHAIAAIWAKKIRTHIGTKGRVAFLVWGDPSLFDSTLRIAERVARTLPLEINVIPGITAVQALTAGHAIPLNRINAPITITTGRQIRDHGWPDGADSVVVMLDGECSFQTLDQTGLYIWWSAYAGMEAELTLSGPLPDIADQIIQTRARARAAHGWIMDIYLLRRQRPA
jgi:precorrin-6A synthase